MYHLIKALLVAVDFSKMIRGGNFGVISKAYDEGRDLFPEEVVLHCLKRYISGNVLDLGCGTGIATRQIRSHVKGQLIGTDADELMLDRAHTHKDGIEYIRANTAKLPFEDDTFALVTAFSSFHWFHSDKDLKEIHRVLVPGGAFVVINRYKSFSEEIKRLVSKFLSKDFSNIKKYYNPLEHMKAGEFEEIKEKEFVYKNKFTPLEALGYYHSTSWSQEVPVDKKEKVDTRVLEYLMTCANSEGTIESEIRVKVVSGVKS